MASKFELVGNADLVGMQVLDTATVSETDTATISLFENDDPVMECSRKGCYALLFVPYD